MNPLYTDIVGSWVRAFLLLVSAFLIQHHVVTATQGEALSALWFQQILNAVPGLISLGWSAWQKYGARVRLNTALTMPAGKTLADVDAKISTGVGIPSAKTAATVVPTAVAVLLLVAGFLTASCSASLEVLTRQAITTNEQLHCGPSTPKPPLCLSDVQFRAVATDLHAVAVAGLNYTIVLEAASKAKTQPPVSGITTMLTALTTAFTNIGQTLAASPDLSTRILGPLKSAVRKL